MTDLKANTPVAITEKKSDAILGPQGPQTCDDLWTLASLDNNGDWGAAKLLFTEEVAKEHFKSFLVGKEKIKVYGNPLTMYHRSLFWKDALKKSTDVSHLLPNIELSTCCCEFIVLWSFINGALDFSHHIKRTNLVNAIDQTLVIWTIHIYFGVKVGDILSLIDLAKSEVDKSKKGKTDRIKIRKLLDWSIGLSAEGELETADKVIGIIRQAVLGYSYTQYTHS